MSKLVYFTLLLCVNLVNSLNCYECQAGSPTPCTKTCANALSCAYQINLPLQATNQQSTRCEMTISTPGCVGDQVSQTVTCYCTVELCNQNLNSTPGLPIPLGGGLTQSTVIPPLGQPINGLPNAPQPILGQPVPPIGLPTPVVQPGILPFNPIQPQSSTPFFGRRRRDVDDLESTVEPVNVVDPKISKNRINNIDSGAIGQQLSSIMITCIIVLFTMF